jgi:hypothetical protein
MHLGTSVHGEPAGGETSGGELRTQRSRALVSDFFSELLAVGYGVRSGKEGPGVSEALLVSAVGTLRPADTHDPFLLNLARLPSGSRILLADVGRADFPARLLERSLTEVAGDRFSFGRAELKWPADLRQAPLSALIARLTPAEVEPFLDELRQRAKQEQAAAVLIGPWLPAGTDHRLLREGGVSIGETTSPPEGAAGRRLVAALNRLLSVSGVTLEAVRVEQLLAESAGVRCRPLSERFGAVVVATGGLVGGGVAWGTQPGQGWTTEVLGGIASGVGSLSGTDATRDAGRFVVSGFAPGLDRGALDERIFLAGDVARGSALRLLAAAQSGLTAGFSAAELVGPPR